MSIHFSRVSTCPCFILYTVSKRDQTNNIHSGFIANSKYKIQALYKDQNCIFQAPKLSTKNHIHADVQNLDCNVTLKWKQILFQSTGDMHTSACFKIVNKCKISKFVRFKFKDFSSTFNFSSNLSVFKHFQGPWSFYSKFKHFQGFLKHTMNPVHFSGLST